jgi:DNA-binding transcriptional MerR regulator
VDTITISEVAERTGFSASALRYYEAAGLVTPARTAAGYRSYSEDDLTALRFIGRAKRLGLRLEEIAEIVPLLDELRCQPVQDQLRSFVQAKMLDTQRRTTDLIGLLGRLRSVAARLDQHTPDGACDDRCGCTTDPAVSGDDRCGCTTDPDGACDDRRGCTTDPAVSGDGTRVDATSGAGRSDDDLPLVCNLAPADMGDRLLAWSAFVAGQVTGREAIEHGVRLRLPRSADIGALAQLVADEQTCCSFFTFGLTVSADGIVLDVTAPDTGLGMIHALVGAPT